MYLQWNGVMRSCLATKRHRVDRPTAGTDRAVAARAGGAWQPRADERKMLSGILFVLKTGCRCKDMPFAYGSYKTVWHRHKTWSANGLFQTTWLTCLGELERLGGIDGERCAIDASDVPAKRGAKSRRLAARA